jgi:hypothetical protein
VHQTHCEETGNQTGTASAGNKYPVCAIDGGHQTSDQAFISGLKNTVDFIENKFLMHG